MDIARVVWWAFLCSTAGVWSAMLTAKPITQMVFALDASPHTSSTLIVDAKSETLAASTKEEDASYAIRLSCLMLAPIPASSKIVSKPNKKAACSARRLSSSAATTDALWPTATTSKTTPACNASRATT